MTTTPLRPVTPSRFLAAELRAECARQGLSARELARRLDVPHAWVNRRLSPTAEQAITIEDLVEMTKALGVSAESLLVLLLPRLDSNQQPSGYQYPQVRARIAGGHHPSCPGRHGDAGRCICPRSSTLVRADLALVA